MICSKKKLDRIKAMIIIANAKHPSSNHNRNETRYYYCNSCNAYHTTSKKR